MSNITNNNYTHWNNQKWRGGGISPSYIVYHLTEKSNKESVLDKPNIRETKRKEIPKGGVVIVPYHDTNT